MPTSVTRGFWSGNSSWSVASISASSLMTSTGGAFRRSASSLSPPSPSIAWTCSVRLRVSGLYWRVMTRTIAAVVGSISTMPPLSRRGEPGKPVTEALLLARPRRPAREWSPSSRHHLVHGGGDGLPPGAGPGGRGGGHRRAENGHGASRQGDARVAVRVGQQTAEFRRQGTPERRHLLAGHGNAVEDEPLDPDVDHHEATPAGSGQRNSASFTGRPSFPNSVRIASKITGMVIGVPPFAATKAALTAMLWMLPPARLNEARCS